MRKHFWTALGVLLTLAMIGLSAAINYSFGYSLGSTETNARIFGAVSVVAVGVMAVLPLRISWQWAAGRKGRAGLGAGGLRDPGGLRDRELHRLWDAEPKPADGLAREPERAAE
jgi:hypothetical protein